MSPPYRPRLISSALSADLDTFPVVVLTGARQAGKSTLAGSANLLLMEAVADSLAGRAAYRTLHPITRREQLGLTRVVNGLDR